MLTISLGFGASVTVVPFGCLFLSILATMFAYGTAAMDAKPGRQRVSPKMRPLSSKERRSYHSFRPSGDQFRFSTAQWLVRSFSAWHCKQRVISNISTSEPANLRVKIDGVLIMASINTEGTKVQPQMQTFFSPPQHKVPPTLMVGRFGPI